MVQKVLKNLKIASLNKMQMAVMETAKKANDILLLSPTGSGKTLAFLLPALMDLDPQEKGVQTLILVPSRELAIQIEQVFKSMGTGFKVNCCYGGHSTKIEKNNLEQPPALLIATPGRMAYHLRSGNVNIETIHTLILDEFDKGLEFGFQEEMSYIILQLKRLKKRFLTSATKMDHIPSFTGITNPTTLNFLNDAPASAPGLTVKAVTAAGKDKLETLFSLICKLGTTSKLVFCNHRDAVERISTLLDEKGIAHGIFHGGMEQEDRERALIKFRNGSHRLLITTDLASRGLDIPEIEAIIHYQLPHTEEVFIHRNGRTARMNAAGTSYLILSEEEHVPPFIKTPPIVEVLTKENILPENTLWCTLYISAGKKDKINKIDIVGLLIQKGNLSKEEVGLIEVLDHSSYVAVNSRKVDTVLRSVQNEKIKNKKVKIEVAK